MNSVQVNGKTYTKEFVYEKLSSDQAWVERALVRLLERQTTDEQYSESTNRVNGRGFTQGDAKWLTKMAQWVKSGRHLSPAQFAIVVKKDKRGTPRIAKYAGQVLQIIAEQA